MPGLLQHSPAAIVRRLLINKGAGTDPTDKQAWPVFDSGEADKPDSAITVYDTEGHLQGREMIEGETHDFHGIMVQVRAAGHSAGYAKARAIAVLFDKSIYWNTIDIGTSKYTIQSIGRTSDVLALGKEPGTKRNLFTINALATLRQVA